jgi:hypothetical protein
MFLVWQFFLENLLSVALYCVQIFFKLLFTIYVAPVITGMTKHSFSTFAEFLYLDFYNALSASFCISPIFLSDFIATSVSKQVLSFLY